MIKVIIADDQELIRESLKIVLGTHEDIQVVDVASDGFEVIHILEQETADVILMDIRMPGNGWCSLYKNCEGKISSNKNYYFDNI